MFTDADDVTNIVIAGFDSVVDLTLKVKISVTPKIPCMRGRDNRVTEDLNRKPRIFPDDTYFLFA